MNLIAPTHFIIAEFNDPEERELANGILLQVDNNKRRTRTAKVLSVGPDVSQVAEGDIIMVQPHMVDTFTFESNPDLISVREQDVLCTLVDDTGQ